MGWFFGLTMCHHPFWFIDTNYTVCSVKCAYSKIPLNPPFSKGEVLPPFRKGGISDWYFLPVPARQTGGRGIYSKWSQMKLKLVL